jgi:hypothetical protein
VTAVLAGVIGAAVIAFALSLPGITLRGAVVGGFFVTAGILTWTATDRPLVIWAVLGAGGVVFAIWSWPWLRQVPAVLRLGTAWLGIAYWLLGVIGALLVGHLGVASQRAAYAGVFTLAAFAVLAARYAADAGRGDVTVGIAAAILVAIGALFLAGAGTMFDAVHAVPNDNPATLAMRDRFWGGPLLYYHPNSLAGLAVIVAVRIGPDRAFAVWQRLAATALAAFTLVLTDSRTAFVFAGFAALLHGVLVLRPGSGFAGFPRYRRTWLAIATPLAAVALVFVLTGGGGFLFQNRFGGRDVTSGRVDTWRQVWVDWQAAGPAEKLFGDANTSRAVVTRTNDGQPPGAQRLKLNTDNAAVGAFRRGGVLGALAFLFGLGLLLWHARGAPAWFALASVAVLPTIATEDWLIGGTNGVLWMLLLAGEASTAVHANRPAHADARSG